MCNSHVWLCVGFAYVGVSVVLFLVGRFSPYEWHIDTSGPEATMKNAFSVWNSLWFVFATLVQQGCEVAPRAVSSRIVASVWYLFTLIIISSYTANLAAFLTAARMNSPINSVEDLAKQTAIKYGILRGGATMAFFQKTNYSTYKKMWNYMEKNPEVFSTGNDDGIERVRKSNGRYAYLVDSTLNEYISNRKPCNTMKVGSNLNSQGFGVGMPLDSDLKSKINIAILQLTEQGKLEELEKKWWREYGDICEEKKDDSGATSRLTVTKIEGIFHIIGGGMAAGILIAVCELLYSAKKDSIKSTGAISFLYAFKSHFSLFLHGSNLPAEEAQVKSLSEEPKETEPAKTKRDQFLSTDDVFYPSPAQTLTRASPNPPPKRQRGLLKATNSLDPKTYKPKPTSTSSSAYYGSGYVNGGETESTSSPPAPPEEFRSLNAVG